MVEYLKCASCNNDFDQTLLTVCLGTKHPEKGFCGDDMFFCPPCLSQPHPSNQGYCDWCLKRKRKLDIIRLRPNSDSNQH